MLAMQDRDLLPSGPDIAAYRDQGYYVSTKIFADAEIEAARTGAERFWRGERDWPLPGGGEPPESNWRPGDGDGLRKNDFAALQIKELDALMRKPVLGAIAAALCAQPVRLFQDQLIYKPPDRPNNTACVGWHVDRDYWRCNESDDMLTAWIPLQDTGREMGPLTLVEGSHRWDVTFNHLRWAEFQERKKGKGPIAPPGTLELSFWDDEMAVLEERIVALGLPYREVPMALEKGQVSFHHCRIIHGSGPNRTSRRRMSLSVHLQDGPNRYRRHPLPDGTIAYSPVEALCRRQENMPDFTDPEVFPQLWPR